MDLWSRRAVLVTTDVLRSVLCYIASAAKVLALGLRVGMLGAPQLAYPRARGRASCAWGRVAYGGRAATEDGRLPRRLRVASGCTVLVLAGAAWALRADITPAT